MQFHVAGRHLVPGEPERSGWSEYRLCDSGLLPALLPAVTVPGHLIRYYRVEVPREITLAYGQNFVAPVVH